MRTIHPHLRDVSTVVSPDHHSDKIATTINSLTSTKTSQNTMYCGGEPEHKHIMNKCMCEEICTHNNGILAG